MSDCLTIVDDYRVVPGRGYDDELVTVDNIPRTEGVVEIFLNEEQLRIYEKLRKVMIRARSTAGHLGICLEPRQTEDNSIELRTHPETEKQQECIICPVTISILNNNVRFDIKKIITEAVEIGTGFLPYKPVREKLELEGMIGKQVNFGHSNVKVVDSPDDSGYCLKIPLNKKVYPFNFQSLNEKDFLEILQKGRSALFREGIRGEEYEQSSRFMDPGDFLITGTQILTLDGVHADIVSSCITETPNEVVHTSATLLHAKRTGNDHSQTSNGHNPSNTHLEIYNNSDRSIDIFDEGFVLLKLYEEVIPDELKTVPVTSEIDFTHYK